MTVRRLNLLRHSVLTAAILGTPWSNFVSAADPAPPAAARTAETALEDVTDKVELQTTGSLRSDRSGRFFTGIVLQNISDEELTGRLVVVVDETGIKSLKATSTSGKLESGESYLEVLPLEGKLKAGERTRSARLDLESSETLSASARKAFSLQVRVFRLGPSEAAPEDAPQVAQGREELLPGKSYSQARLDQVMAIQNRWTERLMKYEGVHGTATGEDDNGNPVVVVYTQRHGIIKNLPGTVEGVALDQQVTGGPFRAGPAWDRVIEINGRKKALGPPPAPEAAAAAEAAGALTPLATPTGPYPTDPTIRFPRPVPIGVSIFNRPDVCAAGTLGCRVVYPDGTLGILSNSHVMARAGLAATVVDNPLLGTVGDDITQPGCLDGGSDVVNSVDIIARLTDFQPFSAAGTNTIDAAIAAIQFPNDGLVMACTPGDGYGFPSRTPKQAQLGMEVKKYGRTTTYREGKIKGINSNVLVAYQNNVDIFFLGQITIIGDHQNFSQAGDSGSLIVTKQGNHPVALLFAGAGVQTAANPIQLVLERFDVAIDDGSKTPPAPGLNGKNRDPGARTSGRGGQAGGTLTGVPQGP